MSSHVVVRSPLRSRFAPVLVLGAFLAGCGGTEAVVPQLTTSATVPALLSAPHKPGEILVDGDASPKTHGPISLHGSYRVRFVQYAPEDPQLDFTTQTAFVARLRPSASVRSRGIALFRAAARSGSRQLRLDGRYAVEVSFGDFPYAIRFTPTAGR